MSVDRQLLAVELVEKLLHERIKQVNKEKRLMLSLKHF